MVQVASSSKSSRSQGKSMHTAFKVGPPTKKTVAISTAKAKKAKQESIKKYTGKKKIFLLSGCTSDVEFEQMKTQMLSLKVQRQVSTSF